MTCASSCFHPPRGATPLTHALEAQAIESGSIFPGIDGDNVVAGGQPDLHRIVVEVVVGEIVAIPAGLGRQTTSRRPRRRCLAKKESLELEGARARPLMRYSPSRFTVIQNVGGVGVGRRPERSIALRDVDVSVLHTHTLDDRVLGLVPA